MNDIPSNEDINRRYFTLVLNARANFPFEEYIFKDSVVISIIHNPTINTNLYDTACENIPYQINTVTILDYSTLEWHSTGDGSFNDPFSASPEYTLSNNDILNGTVTLKVRAFNIGPCTEIAEDSIILIIYHEPVPQFDYNPIEGCSPLSVDFSNMSTGEELVYEWDF